MTTAPVFAAVGGLVRRRVHTIVIAVVLLITTTACVLAAALIVDSDGPFDKAFAAQRGAHLTVTVDPARATAAELAAAAKLPQVTAAAGPFAEVAVDASVSGGPNGGEPLPFTETIAGRASPGGPVDDIILQSGHWPRRPGQIVLGSTWPGGAQFIPLGATVTVTGVPGNPELTVVGFGTSITESADAWALPAEIERLQASGAPRSAQMLYRFRASATAAQLAADGLAVTAALPAGTVTGTQSYLPLRSAEQSSIAPFLPFIIAIGVIGLVMSLLIVAGVISGSVVAGYGRIGVLKSIGFTPGQVVAVYATQAVAPAAAGCAAGAVLGVATAGRLVLSGAAAAYGVGTLGGLPAWLAVGVPGSTVRADRPRRATSCAACWPARPDRGARRRARAQAQPRQGRIPADRRAAAAPAGDGGTRRPVHPPCPHRRDTDRRAARCPRGNVRRRAEHIPAPHRERPDPGADLAEFRLHPADRQPAQPADPATDTTAVERSSASRRRGSDPRPAWPPSTTPAWHKSK